MESMCSFFPFFARLRAKTDKGQGGLFKNAGCSEKKERPGVEMLSLARSEAFSPSSVLSANY